MQVSKAHSLNSCHPILVCYGCLPYVTVHCGRPCERECSNDVLFVDRPCATSIKGRLGLLQALSSAMCAEFGSKLGACAFRFLASCWRAPDDFVHGMQSTRWCL